MMFICQFYDHCAVIVSWWWFIHKIAAFILSWVIYRKDFVFGHKTNFNKVLFIEMILSLSQIFWLTEERREELCTDGDSFHNNKQTWIMLILKHAANKWVQTIIRDPSPVTISGEYHSFNNTNHKYIQIVSFTINVLFKFCWKHKFGRVFGVCFGRTSVKLNKNHLMPSNNVSMLSILCILTNKHKRSDLLRNKGLLLSHRCVLNWHWK